VAYRETGIGWLFRRDPARAVEQLRAALDAHDGNLVRAAPDLMITRRQLYRLVYRANLWTEVDQMRARREPVPADIRRALEVL
jgi:hypothetical protein